jgi:hypothetical protein
MGTKCMPFFLAQAREWWAAADMLRARLPEGAPVLAVWREAAWLHLLLTWGLYGAAVARLRVVFREVVGADPPESDPPRCEADVLSVAADIFSRMRAVVSARYPFAFDRPVAA